MLVARCTWDEIDVKTRTWKLSSDRTKNAKSCEVHLSDPVIAVLNRANERGIFLFSRSGDISFQDFSSAKRELDQLSGVTGWRLHDLRRTCISGMARLGIAPHVADKILNHQAGTISGVAAVYQRHDFLIERREALEAWGNLIPTGKFLCRYEGGTNWRTAANRFACWSARGSWRLAGSQSHGCLIHHGGSRLGAAFLSDVTRVAKPTLMTTIAPRNVLTPSTPQGN
jgi:hypothetical protein